MNANYTRPVNLGNTEEYTIREFADLIKEIAESDSAIVHRIPAADDPNQRRPDISTAKKHINWEPRFAMKQGLEETVVYFRQLLETDIREAKQKNANAKNAN